MGTPGHLTSYGDSEVEVILAIETGFPDPEDVLTLADAIVSSDPGIIDLDQE